MDYAKSVDVPCIKCDTLKKAMDKIQSNLKDKDVVLLSPASASWDQYKRFEDRGQEFKDLVNNLK